MIRPFVVVFWWLVCQSFVLAQTDSPVIMPYHEFVDYVKKNHPLLRQAQLLNDLANSELLMQRGQFDPKLESRYDDKTFKSKQYFYHWNSQLKIPTWTGTDFKFGYEQNNGPFLDSEFDTDGGRGYWYAGVSVPIGQGLLMDARRATLRQAQATLALNKAEQIKIANKTLLQAAKDYWFWYYKHHETRLLQKAYQLAVERYRLIRISVEQGDLAPLDSIEAKITIQQREIDLRMAQNELKNARLILSNHLWDTDLTPLEISDDIIPPDQISILTDTIRIDQLLEFASRSHPELAKLDAKAKQLELDRRLALENVKPTLRLDYTALLARHAPEKGAQVARQDYKIAAHFSMPLLLRKERGKLQMAKIKIDQNRAELTFSQQQVINELKAAYNDVLTIDELLSRQKQMVDNYRLLTDGEILKFRNGESSVFYVNVRESKWFEAQVKYYDMQHKLGKAVATLFWAAGVGL